MMQQSQGYRQEWPKVACEKKRREIERRKYPVQLKPSLS